MISIVTAYYNRKKLFYETLKSIGRSAYKDFEVIAVDDASSPEERIDDLVGEFPYLRVFRIEEEWKTYFNPCVPFNIGIRKAHGDIIMLQNPECLHVHDVLSHVAKEVNDSNYVTISAYQTGKKITPTLPQIIEKGSLLDYFKSLPQQSCTGKNAVGWYNHSKHRPVAYHFCSAMTRKNMESLDGFDKRFSWGIGFEDAEFIDRVRWSGLNIVISDDVSVIHQWHPPATGISILHKRLYRENGKLYTELCKENFMKYRKI